MAQQALSKMQGTATTRGKDRLGGDRRSVGGVRKGGLTTGGRRGSGKSKHSGAKKKGQIGNQASGSTKKHRTQEFAGMQVGLGRRGEKKEDNPDASRSVLGEVRGHWLVSPNQPPRKRAVPHGIISKTGNHKIVVVPDCCVKCAVYWVFFARTKKSMGEKKCHGVFGWVRRVNECKFASSYWRDYSLT